jgi:small subunit ribosomal protein S10
MQKARIKLVSTDIDKLNTVCEEISSIAEKTGVVLKGPIALPTKKLKLSARRSPSGEGYATWERYEMRIHKRIIDVGLNERALRLVMRIPIPQNVNIEIEMIS